MNYINESDVREFIRRLPDLTSNPPTTHLAMMVIRSRKAKEIMGVKMKDLVVEREIIRAIPNWRERYFNSVYNLSILQSDGKYDARDITVRPEVFGIMGTLSPRNVTTALANLMKENIEFMLHRDDAAMVELAKQNARFFGFLHAHPMGGYHFVTIDIDVLDHLKEIRDIVSVLPIHMITQTARGYHIMLNLNKSQDAKTWYDNSENKGLLYQITMFHGKDVEIQKDAQEPIAGTMYANPTDLHHLVAIVQ